MWEKMKYGFAYNVWCELNCLRGEILDCVMISVVLGLEWAV